MLIARASWTESVNVGVGVDAANLDFSKTFDSIDHCILLHKLQKYGIGDPVLGWIDNFLVQRHLNVRVRSNLSESIEVQCGVPQGSVLGPRLFLVFINDLASVLPSNCLLFADNLKVWRTIAAVKDHIVLQEDLDKAYTWSSEKLLHFNVTNSKVLSIRHKSMHKYRLGPQILQRASLECDLDVIVQDDLGCLMQTEKATKNANQYLDLLRRAFEKFDPWNFPKMLSA
ncbi:unnamed protein product [Dicrocoelium dendriticum]|nr:unnamed protein product [Dicrocoelium dendriticum]